MPLSPAGLARLAAVTVLLIWITFILVARGSARGTLTPLDIAWLRFVFSGLVVLPFAWRYRQALVRGLAGNGPSGNSAPGAAAAAAARLRRAALVRAMALGGFGGLGYCLLAYNAFFLAPVSHAAVLLPGSLPLWSTLGAMLLLGERLTLARVAGVALILAGGAAVAGASLFEALAAGARTWRGDVLFVGASMTWAVYGVLCRRWRVGAVAATGAVALVTLVLAVPAYALAAWAGVVPSRLAEAPVAEIAFQAVYQGGLSMLVAGIAFTQVVAHYGPVRTTMFTAVVPPLAALAAVPVLGEPLAASALLGLALVTLGLLVGSGVLPLRRRRTSH
ncbi:MAG: DMT family transporter [Rubrivivax sp.]|nr:DMT family transporter [Rubrivivax sp.]